MLDTFVSSEERTQMISTRRRTKSPRMRRWLLVSRLVQDMNGNPAGGITTASVASSSVSATAILRCQKRDRFTIQSILLWQGKRREGETRKLLSTSGVYLGGIINWFFYVWFVIFFSTSSCQLRAKRGIRQTGK